MESLTPFKFPAKDGQPLQHLQAERVNGMRQISSISTTTATSKTSETNGTESANPFMSPQSSPTRRAKASLLAEAATPTGAVSGFALPQSPSLPEIHSLRSHVRTNSDVQGLVKRFEHLDVRDRDAESVERKRRHEAELRRAQIAREEAESDVKRLREESRRLKKECDDGRDRERKIAKRLEVLMVGTVHAENRDDVNLEQEEYGSSKETSESQHSIYEKELRKARKEAFKSSSTVVKLQEELKSTRNSLRITQSGLDLEKQKVQRKEQERFEMEYRIIPLQEQLDKLKQKLQTVEQEREALKTTLKEEEVARIAAQGLIALPVSQDMDSDLLSSPQKHLSPHKFQLATDLDEDKENIRSPSKRTLESKRLAEQLSRERMRREHAEELIDFLRLECKFQCCGCKTASRRGHNLALELDEELAAVIEKIRADMEDIVLVPVSASEVEEVEVEEVVVMETDAVSESGPEMETEIIPVEESTEPGTIGHMEDREMTTEAELPFEVRTPDDQLREEQAAAVQHEPETIEIRSAPATMTLESEHFMAAAPSTPPRTHRRPAADATPLHQQPSIRTVTTTTTIPMHFTPSVKNLPPVFSNEDMENIPPTPSSAILPDGSELPVFDRAAALAAIEYRRGRAKSIANGQATPRKQMLEGVRDRRDISAPVSSQVGSIGKGAASVGRGRRG